MHTRIAFVPLLIVTLTATLARAAPIPTAYTWQTFTVPPIGMSTGRLALVALTNSNAMAGDDTRPAGISARIAADLTTTPVTCPPAVFPRYPTPSRGGPQVLGMNNSQTVAGSDEHSSGVLYGLAQTADGTCDFFLVSGSFGTLARNISDLGHVVGHYWNSPFLSTEPGLRRFHGYIRTGTTIAPLAGPLPNDVLFPEAINAVGDIVGYAYRDIQPDNSYVYQAFYRTVDGTLTWLESPSGDDLWCPALNNVGQAVCIVGSNNVVGGVAYLYDQPTQTYTTLPEPTATTVFVAPAAINDNGAINGFYVEEIPGCTPTPTTSCLAFSQFLATPVVTPPATPSTPQGPPIAGTPGPTTPTATWKARHKAWWTFITQRRERIRQHWRTALQEAKAARESRRAPASDRFKALVDTRWRPALDDDGTVVLTNGVQVIGRKYR